MLQKTLILSAICLVAISCSKSKDLPVCSEDVSLSFREFLAVLTVGDDSLIENLEIFKKKIGASSCVFKNDQNTSGSSAGGTAVIKEESVVISAALAERLAAQHAKKVEKAMPVSIEREPISMEDLNFEQALLDFEKETSVKVEFQTNPTPGGRSNSYFGSGADSYSSSGEVKKSELELIKKLLSRISTNQEIVALMKSLEVKKILILNPYREFLVKAYVDFIGEETQDKRLNVSLENTDEEIIEALKNVTKDFENIDYEKFQD